MSKLDSILAFNEHFVEDKQYERFVVSKFPQKKDCYFNVHGHKTN